MTIIILFFLPFKFFFIFYCFTHFTISLFNKYFNFLMFKIIVLTCTVAYLTFFIIFAYFSYKTYLLSLSELSKLHSIYMINDIAKLIYDFPILNNNIQIMPLENIKLAYNIHGIEHYTQFIYPVNKEVEILHSILNYEPEVASRFSSMVIQDIIDTHSTEVSYLTENFVNKMFIYSLPLTVLTLVLVVVTTIEPSSILI